MAAMTVNRVAIFLIYVSIALPIFLFAAEWRRRYPQSATTLLVPTISAALVVVAGIRNLKLLLLGSDYSQRLFVTIDVNLALAIVAAIYFGMKKRWVAGLAALILAADWLYMASVNSAV
jgi:hypothetical protein